MSGLFVVALLLPVCSFESMCSALSLNLSCCLTFFLDADFVFVNS